MAGDQGNNQYTSERRNEGGEMRDRPDMRRGYADSPDMRRPYNRRMGDMEMRRGDRGDWNEMEDSPDMRGEGYFVWDGSEHLPPERYGQPADRRNVTGCSG